MTWDLAGYLTLGISVALIVCDVLWSTYRYKQRTREAIKPFDYRSHLRPIGGVEKRIPDSPWPPAGKERLGLSDEEVA